MVVDAQTRASAEHYGSKYNNVRRWASYWHQVNEIQAWSPESVLYVGQGSGTVPKLLSEAGVRVETLDVNEQLEPDHVGSVTRIPLADDHVDVVACCQVLEHLPYGDVHDAWREMGRVARRAVVVSVPDAARGFLFRVTGTLRKPKDVWIPIPGPRRALPNDRHHHWEVDRRGFPLRRVLRDAEAADLRVERTFRAPEFPYHRFIILTPK